MQLNGIDYGDNWIEPEEFDWSPVAQSADYLVSGALLIEEHTRLAGRPITLQGNWLTRAQVEVLEALRDAGGSVSLTWRGVIYTVYWRHGEKPLEARQVFDTSAPSNDELYAVILRFFEG